MPYVLRPGAFHRLNRDSISGSSRLVALGFSMRVYVSMDYKRRLLRILRTTAYPFGFALGPCSSGIVGDGIRQRPLLLPGAHGVSETRRPKPLRTKNIGMGFRGLWFIAHDSELW